MIVVLHGKADAGHAFCAEILERRLNYKHVSMASQAQAFAARNIYWPQVRINDYDLADADVRRNIVDHSLEFRRFFQQPIFARAITEIMDHIRCGNSVVVSDVTLLEDLRALKKEFGLACIYLFLHRSLHYEEDMPKGLDYPISYPISTYTTNHLEDYLVGFFLHPLTAQEITISRAAIQKKYNQP